MTHDEHNAAFDRWLRDHGAVLHHVANGFAAGADRHDLMQELLLAVWQAVPAYRAGARPSTFIFRVAHNAALMWKRSEKNYRQRVDRFETLSVLPATDDAHAGRRERETLELLYARIRELPPVDRSLLLLHLDGASYGEMAEIHGLSESNVGARLTRAKQKLTQSLQEISHELR